MGQFYRARIERSRQMALLERGDLPAQGNIRVEKRSWGLLKCAGFSHDPRERPWQDAKDR